MHKQLQTRILTALVFAPLLLAAIFMLEPFWFSALMAVLFLYGGWEFSNLCKFSRYSSRLLFTAGIALLLLAGLSVIADISGVMEVADNRIFAVIAMTALWGFSGFFSGPAARSGNWWTAVSVIQGLILIWGCWLALTWLRFQSEGSWWILLLLIIIWVADVAAYFTGRTFGKRKLAPSISPGKTWAGVIGAALITPPAALICLKLSPLPELAILPLVLLVLLTVATSIGGDLYISLHKRMAGVKDSGRLFPGHGGVLDRFDSLVTGSVFFVLGLIYLQP